MYIPLIKQIFILSLLAQIIFQPISYQNINNQKIIRNDTLALDSIFTDDADVEDVLQNKNIQTIVELYREEKLTEKDINNILNYLQDRARQKRKETLFEKIKLRILEKTVYQKIREKKRLYDFCIDENMYDIFISEICAIKKLYLLNSAV